MAANAGTAYIDIEARLDKLQHELDSKISSAAKNASGEASKSFKHTGTAIVGAIASGWIASKGIDFIKSSLEAAASESTGIAALNKVLSNTGVPKSAIDSTQTWLTKIQDSTGVLKDQLEPAFTRLVSAHIPLTRAQQLFNQALDISKARSLPLATVTAALGKAYNGQLGGLTRLGIIVPKLADKHKAFDLAMKGAAKTMGGTAAAAANTAAGKLAIFHARVHEVQVKIGEALIPILTKLGGFVSDHLIPAFEGITTWMSKNKDIIIPLAAVIGTLAVGLGILAAVEKTVELATAALNLVMDANPMVLVALAVAALVAGLIIAYQRVGWFRAAVDAAWNVIKVGTQALFDVVKVVFHALASIVDWLRDHWKLAILALLAPWAVVILGVVKYRDQIVGFFKALPGMIVRAIGALGRFIWDHMGLHTLVTWVSQVPTKIVSFFTGLPGRLAHAAAAVFSWAVDFGKQLVHNVIAGILSLPGAIIDALNPFSGGGKTPAALNPGGATAAQRAGLHRATGGPVWAGQSYTVGERGPEQFIPAVSGTIVPNGGRSLVINQYMTRTPSADELLAASRRAEKLAAVV